MNGQIEKKKGFPVPFSIWLKEKEIYEDVKKEFQKDYAKKFFDTEKIIKLLDEHYDGVKNNCRKVYTIYCFLVWYRTYFIDM